MAYGIDGAALDRHITGNYGEDRGDDRCEDCARWDPDAEEPFGMCAFDGDTTECEADARADAADYANDLARDHG